MGICVTKGATGLQLTRRTPLGRLTYIPRGHWEHKRRPDGLTLINASDVATDANLAELGFLPIVTPQTIAILDISDTDANRLRAAHGKWRNRLRRATREPIHIKQTPFCPHRHGWLLKKETDQRRENRYAALPHAFLQAYPSNKTLVLEAWAANVPIAAMLFLLHFPSATYHLGWSGQTGRALNAHTLLLWRASQILHDRGLRQLELGTLDTKNAPGLARFKLGSGAKPLLLGHTWLFIPGLSPLIRAIRRRGGFTSGLFSEGSIGGPRTSQETPHGSAQHRHHRPR
jgi:lipid II:glycine glycyltransferase (peptidoglycan interpeptide bridge formation enzyme)